jgi:bacitracin transport system permease protein
MLNSDEKVYNDRLTKKELYEQYWRCRDFELQNLWQRSVFLTAFVVLMMTAYGVFFSNVFMKGERIDFFEGYLSNHIVGVLISLLGLVFSMLWVYLAKASKAWYEVYEAAIGALDSEQLYFLPYIGISRFKVEKLPNYKTNDNPMFDTRFFSSKGGVFSPSKINIAIGHVIFGMWAVILGLHSFSLSLKIDFVRSHKESFIQFLVFLLIFLLLIALLIIFQKIIQGRIGSSVLELKDPGGK